MVKNFDLRKYVVPITRYVLVAPKHERTKKAISVIKNFVIKNTRAKKIVFGEELNKKMWAHSIEYPPRKVNIFVQKLSDGVFVNLEGSPLRIEKKPEVKKDEKKEGLEKIAVDAGKTETKVEAKPIEKKEEKKEVKKEAIKKEAKRPLKPKK